jgi:hypothetical protein
MGIDAHEEIIFEESRRPIIGVVTLLTKSGLCVLCLTDNQEAVPYETLLHKCDADTAAHNARVVYEACLQLAATGRSRLGQVPHELAFDDCAVKEWVLNRITFKVWFRNGETIDVTGTKLKRDRV